MKFAPRNDRRAHSALRVAATLLAVALLPFLLRAAAPFWWSQRGVIVQDAAPDDYAPANQGQLKYIAKAAAAEMDARLSGGAGNEIHLLIDSWTANPATNDFAPVNLGQLKNVAKLFYDRLISAGLADVYPWLRSPDSPDDFAVANLGQLKNLFNFDIPNLNQLDVQTDRIAAGQFSACLALEPNATWIWNDQLNGGSDSDRMYPRRLAGLPALGSVAAGERYLAVLAADGTVWTWGDNSVGQLGDGTYVSRNSPAVVPNLNNVASIKAGGSHVLVLGQDETVSAWGDNRYGQLGTGDTISSPVPVTVAGMTDVRRIAAGFQRSAALKNDGTVWTWGYERYDNQDIFRVQPVAVPELVDVVDVAAGYEHMVAVKADGTVWVWGSNYANQLANDNPWWKYQDVPFQVTNLPSIVKVASSYDHTLALANDGTVWAWGYNFDGQLGDGTDQLRTRPVQVVGLTGVIAIATAYSYSLAMKSDGTVWAWGNGARGIVQGPDRYRPQQVGLGLLDTNHNEMDDRWEMQFFGNLNQSGDGDFDGDGVSNRLESLRGTNPTDFYNGMPPVIEIAGGNNQVGDPGAFLAKPYTVRVHSPDGRILVNAPLTFTVTSGGGALSFTPDAPQQQAIATRTNANGEASVYHVLPDTGGISTRTTALAGLEGASSAVTIRGISRLSPSSSPPPSPPQDPSATPGPSATPSSTPSATPAPPYRYAIIDLGPDVYPSRVNNKGVILVQGADANGDWGSGRWKAGAIEWLKPATPNRTLKALDLNDEGTAVGWEARADLDRPWLWFVIDQVNDFTAGLIWPSNNPTPKVLNGPVTPYWDRYAPGSIREAYLSVISNRNIATNQIDLYGGVYLGEGPYGFSIFDYHQILNAQRWSEDLGARVQLSFSSSTVTSWVPFPFIEWHGPMDRITRANSSGHYIGSRLTPREDILLSADGAGIVDGQIVDFDPIDINEKSIVVGSKGTDMIIKSPGQTKLVFANGYAIAVNDHTRPAASSDPPPSPTTTPQPSPSPVPAPQVIGWQGNALAIWELQPDGKTWHPFGLEEMIPSMDGWDYLTPTDMNDNGVIVGTAWYTDPSISGARAEQHGFMLLPIPLLVDADRDGTITQQDATIPSEDNPYRFWVNDDDDALDTSGNDIPGNTVSPNFATQPRPDGKDTGTINGTRDVIDFFPVYLDLNQLLNLFPATGPTACKVKLKHETGSLNFAYSDLTANNAFNYLHEVTGATADNAGVLGGTEPGNGAITTHITKAGTQLDPAWLNRIQNSEGYGVVLLEGRTPTEKPLVLEIEDSTGTKRGVISLPIKVSPVEQMYRHKNLRPADNATGGRADYATGLDTQHSEPENYPDSLCDGNVFVFVHGYKVTSDEARGWNAEMFKRLYQSGSKAKFYGITWHGDETDGTAVPPYQKNVDNAFATAEAFRDFANGLSGRVTVAAHSLGNIVVGSAIHDWKARIAKYFMVDAAVAIESYWHDAPKNEAMTVPTWATYKETVWTSEWFNNPTFNNQDKRRTLSWRGRLASVGVTAYNFFSHSEDVLRQHDGDPTVSSVVETALTGGRHAWALQEKLKGLQVDLGVGRCGSTYGGWQFSHNFDSPGPIPSDQVARLSMASLTANPVFDPGFTVRTSPPPPEGQVPPKDIHRGAPMWIIDLTDSTKGSAAAAEHANQLLAEMFPARTLPAGANTVDPLENRNFDMPVLFSNSWPNERGEITDWLHSDLKVVAYPYMFRLFDKWKQLMEE
jgi:hypothetical protein